MNCNFPGCPGGAVSYPLADEYKDMPEIPVTCEECGQTWYEPNNSYVKPETHRPNGDYYDRFR